jgi:hypothetical protein
LTGLVQAVEEECSLVDGGADGQQSRPKCISAMILHVPDPEGFRIPVVLQNASHIITQSVRDGPTLVLSKRYPGVIVIDAQLAMEITGIYSKKSN